MRRTILTLTLLSLFCACKPSGYTLLNEYKDNGESQGQLMGNNRDYKISKRESCGKKKNKVAKEGINGQKAMVNKSLK